MYKQAFCLIHSPISEAHISFLTYQINEDRREAENEPMQEVVVENDEEPEANNDQEDEPIEVGGFLQLKILRLSYKKL